MYLMARVIMKKVKQRDWYQSIFRIGIRLVLGY
jgi:hypothetical protein